MIIKRQTVTRYFNFQTQFHFTSPVDHGRYGKVSSAIDEAIEKAMETLRDELRTIENICGEDLERVGK